ncbi:MAG: yidD [Firmicutes bacterium]|nr:yidD [Bacillota bacterium]
MQPGWNFEGLLIMGKWILLSMIRFYRVFLSPLKPPSCRYTPTCSEYTLVAIEKYGVFRGLKMAICRVARCHPFHSGGYDPVK